MSSMPVKYFFRLLHVGLYGLLFAFLFVEKYFKDSYKKENIPKWFISIPIVFMIAGFVNMIILIKDNKYVKNGHLTFWKYLLYAKVGLFALLTPLWDKLLASKLLGLDSETTINMRFLFFILALVISPYSRFYREAYLTKGDYNQMQEKSE